MENYDCYQSMPSTFQLHYSIRRICHYCKPFATKTIRFGYLNLLGRGFYNIWESKIQHYLTSLLKVHLSIVKIIVFANFEWQKFQFRQVNIKLQNWSKSPFLSFLKDGKVSNVNNFERPKSHFHQNVSFAMVQLSFFEK